MKANDDYNRYKEWSINHGLPIRSYNNFCHLRQYFSDTIKPYPEYGDSVAGDRILSEKPDPSDSVAVDVLKESTTHTLNIIEGSPLHDAVIKAMECFANLRTAQVREGVDRLWSDVMANARLDISTKETELENVKSQLSEANKRIAELSEQIQDLGSQM